MKKHVSSIILAIQGSQPQVGTLSFSGLARHVRGLLGASGFVCPAADLAFKAVVEVVAG